MPNIKSAIKRLRQSKKRRVINRTNTSNLRTAIKKYRTKIEEGDFEGARAMLNETYGQIDKANKAGVIHANRAARLKSRLTVALNRSDS